MAVISQRHKLAQQCAQIHPPSAEWVNDKVDQTWVLNRQDQESGREPRTTAGSLQGDGGEGGTAISGDNKDSGSKVLCRSSLARKKQQNRGGGGAWLEHLHPQRRVQGAGTAH